MGFSEKEVEQLLVDTGRKCCICDKLHSVQVHHIVPKEEGGTDDIDNAITLCPNCHNEVHQHYVPGQVTRVYTVSELKGHRKKTIELARKKEQYAAGSRTWSQDKKLILFYAQCLDRRAFRVYFHQEQSFTAFDKAMEDTLTALNTGYWRMTDGTLIERAEGKVHVVNPEWRQKLDQIAGMIESIRDRFHKAFGLNQMLMEYDRPRFNFDMEMDAHFRRDRDLGQWIDKQRQEIIAIMNSMLKEIGQQPLRKING